MPATRRPTTPGAELDQLVHTHLAAHPEAMLTANDVARALGRGPYGKSSVNNALRRLQEAGRVVCVPVDNPYGSRPMYLWQAAPQGAST
jgi:predicted transcriptional regulator